MDEERRSPEIEKRQPDFRETLQHGGEALSLEDTESSLEAYGDDDSGYHIITEDMIANSITGVLESSNEKVILSQNLK